MVETENTIIPSLREYMSFWKRYIDDSISFVKIGTNSYIITILNNFDPNITFTYEIEKVCKLLFLDMVLIKKGSNIATTVYCRTTTNHVYLDWKSFARTTLECQINVTLA